jgi:hypothetical protein
VARLYARERRPKRVAGPRVRRFVILRAVMATLRTDGGDLVLALSRRERIGALHGDVRVPLSCVEDVAVTPHPFGELRGIRAPGTGMPGVIALGTWRGRGEKGFAAVYRQRPGVVVRLRDSEFAWLCVSAGDPQAVAERIRAAL